MRQHPRRGRPLALIRHVDPAEAIGEANARRDLTEPLELADLHRQLADQVPAVELAEQLAAGVSRETSQQEASCRWAHGPSELLDGRGLCPVCAADEEEAPPPLSRLQVAKLEALTALWERQVRQEVPADATLVYGSPTLPPVPPSRAALTPAPAPAEGGPDPVAEPGPAPAAAVTVERRVSGWRSRHDPASLDYAVRALLHVPVPLQDRILETGPILDQGTVPPLDLRTASACTGMATVAAANVLELATAPPYAKPADVAFLTADDARSVYFRAQDLDAVSGHDYAGTSVLAAMKAGQEAGWWDTYLWALGGTRDVAQVILQLGVAVVVGLPWGPSLDAPDAAGVIAPTELDGSGHALAVVGIKRRAVDGRPGPWFVLQQSRGAGEGLAGRVYLHHAHLAGLLAGVGEAAVPLPRWGLAEGGL